MRSCGPELGMLLEANSIPDLTLAHISGTTNVAADWLSRLRAPPEHRGQDCANFSEKVKRHKVKRGMLTTSTCRRPSQHRIIGGQQCFVTSGLDSLVVPVAGKLREPSVPVIGMAQCRIRDDGLATPRLPTSTSPCSSEGQGCVYGGTGHVFQLRNGLCGA